MILRFSLDNPRLRVVGNSSLLGIGEELPVIRNTNTLQRGN
jgi:hypothetical protein